MYKLPWCNVILFSAWFYKPVIVIKSNFDWLHWSFSWIFFGTNIFEKKRHSNNFPRSTLFKKTVADNHMTTVLPLVTFVNMHLTCLTVVVCMKERFKSQVSEVFLSFKATIYQDWKIYFVAYIHYGTAPVDPCRPQNRGSHDYLRAHKGSQRMSHPLIQDSSVRVSIVSTIQR